MYLKVFLSHFVAMKSIWLTIVLYSMKIHNNIINIIIL